MSRRRRGNAAAESAGINLGNASNTTRRNLQQAAARERCPARRAAGKDTNRSARGNGGTNGDAAGDSVEAEVFKSAARYGQVEGCAAAPD